MAITQINNNAVFCKNNILGFHTGENSQLAIGNKVTDFPVNRHDVCRLNDVVAVDQFAGSSVTGHVNLRIGLVNNLCAQASQVIDHPVHRVFIPGNQRRGKNDSIAGIHTDKAV